MIESFRYAVDNHYWYNMVLDELPIWAMVGELRTPNASAPPESRERLIYTHKRLSIGYNDDRIIEVPRASLPHGQPLGFHHALDPAQGPPSRLRRKPAAAGAGA